MRHQHPGSSTKECPLADGRTLTYATAGDPEGAPVVVCHGTPGSRSFAAVCSDTAAVEGVHLVVPERPGYGTSTPPPRGWSWGDWRADLHQLLDHEGIERTALVGYSGGGPFALAAATDDRTTRIGLISSVIPPVENGFATLSRAPLLLRFLSRLAVTLAGVRGPDAVVRQFTDESVAGDVRRAVSEDFHEGFRQGARAFVRETRLLAEDPFDGPPSNVPVRAWHGTRDGNAPIRPVRKFLRGTGGSVVTSESDHLGTLLDHQRDVFAWTTG
ncbi:alpha/beta hydrolase [Haloplanus salilacus]|uniref:alpha/beta hydrolase n=1 Tax=Haloplanus salilacus TaxID=2949994 RepID=UPI0030D25BF7